MNLTRRFDADRYLDGKPQPLGFREWAVRANNRIERLLDETDWKAVELIVERRVFPVLFSGVAIYFCFVVLNAILGGAFASGGAR